MTRIPMDDAIQRLVAEYQTWLEDSADNVEKQWSHFFDQDASTVEDNDELLLEIDDEETAPIQRSH